MPGSLPPTPNYGFYQGQVNVDTGWGTDCDNTFLGMDGALAGVLNTSISGDFALTPSQWQNHGVFLFTGSLSGNATITLPLNGPGTAAVAGRFVIDNRTSGNGTLTIKTVVSGSVGVVCPQGARTSLLSDSANVYYADDSRYAKIQAVGANPNGVRTGNAGSDLTGQGADIVWDLADQQLVVSVGSGGGPGTSGTSWRVIGQNIPVPQGYLNLNNTDIILVVDGSNNILGYAPYRGNLVPIWNGSVFTTVSFSPLGNLLTGAQAPNNLYDVFIAITPSGAPDVCVGPSWLSGATAGSITPGSCMRGIGNGSTDLQRINGIWTNAHPIPAANGGSGIVSIAQNQGTYVGTIGIGATAGQMTCLRGWGGGGIGSTARRWDIWNAYQRMPITMQVGDNTVSWNNNVNGWRESNGGPNSRAVTVIGLREEQVTADFSQLITPINNRGAIGINLNNPALTPNGYTNGGPTTVLAGGAGSFVSLRSRLVTPPLLGFNHIIACENPGNNGNETFYGGQSFMYMTVQYNG